MLRTSFGVWVVSHESSNKLIFSQALAILVASILTLSLFPACALGADSLSGGTEDSDIHPASYLPVGTVFTGSILVGGVSYDCKYKTTGAGTVQIGSGDPLDSATNTSIAGALEIPATVPYGGDSYTVTSLGDFAFYTCASLTSTGLATNTTVTSLGSNAFSGCTSLTSTGLEANSAVTSMGGSAFANCTSLTSTGLATNSAVTSVGFAVFCYDTSLTSTGLATNSSVISLEHGCFGGCTSLTSTGLATNSAVTSMEDDCFGGCTSLASTGLETNSTLTSLGDSTFVNCTSLTSTGLATNSAVNSVGASCFSGCTALSGDLVLGSHISSIGNMAFDGAGYSAVYLLAPNPASVSIASAVFQFDGLADPSPLYVPASWDGTGSFTTGYYTYSAANGSLVIMYAPKISEATASRISAQDASVSFRSSAAGAVHISDNSGASVWTGPVSANTPMTASLSGIESSAASFGVEVAAVYPSSAVPTWYNSSSVSAVVDVPAFTYAITFDGNGSSSGLMADQAMLWGASENLGANGYEKNGFEFAGWNTAADGSGASYADGQSISNLAKTDKVVLYAQWRGTGVNASSISAVGGSVNAQDDSAGIIQNASPVAMTGDAMQGVLGFFALLSAGSFLILVCFGFYRRYRDNI